VKLGDQKEKIETTDKIEKQKDKKDRIDRKTEIRKKKSTER